MRDTSRANEGDFYQAKFNIQKARKYQAKVAERKEGERVEKEQLLQHILEVDREKNFAEQIKLAEAGAGKTTIQITNNQNQNRETNNCDISTARNLLQNEPKTLKAQTSSGVENACEM